MGSARAGLNPLGAVLLRQGQPVNDEPRVVRTTNLDEAALSREL